MISLEKFPGINDYKIIIDVNNVVFDGKQKGTKPNLNKYLQMELYLSEELGIPKDHIVSICDRSLEYQIDEKP